jgi:hypothetical protein
MLDSNLYRAAAVSNIGIIRDFSQTECRARRPRHRKQWPALAADRSAQARLFRGEIVVGALTRQLVEQAVRFGPVRQIQAKGAGSLEAFQAEALHRALPEQHRGITGLHAPLIGRDGELRLLRESYEKASHERAAYLVTVYGEAGVGKSRAGTDESWHLPAASRVTLCR